MAAGFIPPALALAAMAATARVSLPWAIIALAVGAAAGGLAAAALAGSISGPAERIEAIAAALTAHRQPSHVLPDERDAIGSAERRLIQAADAVFAEIGTLAEQRDEMEAILKSMTDAVVVTGPTAK